MKIKFFILFLLWFFCGFSQRQQIKIVADLNPKSHKIKIIQKIIYYNNSNVSMSNIHFHNWANSYKNKKTLLSKRLLEDYDKSFYFAKKKDRGYSKITSIAKSSDSTFLEFEEKTSDIIKVKLNNALKPKDSVTLLIEYTIKLPNSKFTQYGHSKNNYNLRYWYLIPVVFENNHWQSMSNYNMDDLFTNPTDFEIEFKVPKEYTIQTDLKTEKTIVKNKFTTYYLKGINRTDIELNISTKNSFDIYKTKNLELITNLNNPKIKNTITHAIIEREIAFITDYLGKYPHDKLLVNKITYDKNPVYGLNQLPKILNPFNDVFEFDIKHFKALTNKYINNTILTNRRKDTWLNDGIQTFLMMKYIEKYYPEINAMGKISKIWGIRSYKIAKLKFNDKFPFVFQFATRKNLDQALTTPTDSLSTFNRKIVNKYKSGIGLQYLDSYLNNEIIKKSLQQFYLKNKLQLTKSGNFKEILTNKTSKNLDWFFGDYLQTKKKIDYTITKVKKTSDSIQVTIKNKRNITTPILLYGLNNKNIQFKKWLPKIDSIQTITIPKGDFNKLSLNYENLYPELNSRDNWKNLNSSILNRPIQFRFFKDIENPYYNQVFYNFQYDYNFYDGLILGVDISNKTILKKNWLYSFKPNYGIKSQQIVGSASLIYQLYPEKSSIYRLRAGLPLSTSNYAPDLSFTRISPFVSIHFKRKNLRDVGGTNLSSRYVYINRETESNSPRLESDSYGVFNIKYTYFKPEIIKDLRYNLDFQLADNFSKLALDFRYRKLTDKNRQFDFRLFAGAFVFNDTEDTFFDFSLNRASDYLFDLDYLGRSEETGFLNQQVIITEGGFKSFFDENSANKWMLTTNNSFSIWRWIEIYGDAGLFKNKGFDPVFKYDTGIRFNFVHNILEVYFPLQSSNGFEPSLQNYDSKIRFVLTLSPGKVFNFIKRGFY